ncbi:Protein NUCLEAR FUSION DEFECTIVE 4 [Camellia lanceoleosa]|uniref:Protein NUCLEAR FUSION DEFECTIVE 4 n=1 Tax=Camellia lanceoleosa TaxID=1840588 RepID=A0ACC0HPX6_9ERIC|nr:Protein NUCLEAR FUSION DEFECTIVE 4 [Camellia lanceoleosa]
MVLAGGGGSASTMKSLPLQILTGWWFMVFASLLIMSTVEATYMFGVYFAEIKSSLGYDQTTLNLLSLFKDLGANVGILSGLINEVTPPWVVLSIGAILNLFGYFMIWLSVTKKIFTPQIWQMCLYICIGANSQSFANTGALVTCVKKFPESRGVVLGPLKGFVGLMSDYHSALPCFLWRRLQVIDFTYWLASSGHFVCLFTNDSNRESGSTPE